MEMTEPNPEDPNKQSQDIPVQSKDVIKNEENEKEIYFMITLSKEEAKESEFKFKFLSKIVPEIIYEKEIKIQKGELVKQKVFKLVAKNKTKKKGEKIPFIIQYRTGDYIYTISFTVKENYFVYDINLKEGDYYLKKMVEEDINQNIIPIYNKLEIFLEALGNNKEKIKRLFEEGIELYKEKKEFTFLIFLFYNTYNDKNLCSKLLTAFKEIKGIEKPEIDENLSAYFEAFDKIDYQYININEYDPIYFYSIVLCYFYYYDQRNNSGYFSNKINKLYSENAQILFQILIMFHSNFTRQLNNDYDFHNNFFKYVIDNEDMKTFEKTLNYIKDIELFIKFINENKINIFTKYKDIDPIKINPDLKIIKKDNELEIIIQIIYEIIDYSDNINKLVIYFNSKFWINLLREYNKPDMKNIDNCHKLRQLFKKYRGLVQKLFGNQDEKKQKDKNKDIKDDKSKDKDNIFETKDDKIVDKPKDNKHKYINITEIKNDIEIYYKRDEFTFVLNRNIKDYLSKNDLSNERKLLIIEQYNPYFNEEDIERYGKNRDVDIFDCLNFDKSNEKFIKNFRVLNFEKIFKLNISEFLNKIVSKINNISNFDTVLELININRIPELNRKEYYNLLKDKYEECIKKEIESISSETELNKPIKILSKFVINLFLYEKNNNFLENRISKLENRIKSLIYNELINTYKGKEFEKMKEYIIQLYSKESDNVENIIKLINSINDKDDKNKILKEIINNCEFTEEQFYSNIENKNLKLLCDLNNAKMLNQDCCSEKLLNILGSISKDLEGNTFTKKQLEEFLGGDKNKDKLIEKLSLINIIIISYDPEDKYMALNEQVTKMNEAIERLNKIKDSLCIFHRNKYKDLISEITITINDIETNSIGNFNSQTMQNNIKKLQSKDELCKEVNKVRELSIFKNIFDNLPGDQERRFKSAKEQLNKITKLFTSGKSIEEIYNNNNKIFNQIKDELSKKDESKSNTFIKQMIDYFIDYQKSTGNVNFDIAKKYQEDLTMILKSKKYEMDIKSIEYFFKTFTSIDIKLPENLDLSKMGLKELKNNLVKLENSIYKYNSNEDYYKIFTSLYGKKEAIIFLKEKIDSGQKIDYLKNRLDPTKKRLTINNIDDTIECLNILKIIMEKMKKKESEMLDYIKDLKDDQINKFVSYSKIYQAIIELDRSDDDNDDDNTFKNVDKIIMKASFIFNRDEEDFLFIDNDGKKEETNMEYLTHLKNQISIQNKNDETLAEYKGKDQFEIKCHKLLFFKNLVYNLETIDEKMKILRTKGCNLPISINIEISYPNVVYYLNQKETEFNEIRQFLLKAKYDYENQLNKIYKEKKYLRFLYGKLFRKIQIHLDGNREIEEILRYILNITNDNIIITKDSDNCDDPEFKNYEIIKDGDNCNDPGPSDCVSYFSEYNSKIFDNISQYIISFFKKNGNLDLDKHYEKMLIRHKGNSTKKEIENLKGIYLKDCNKISKEEYILNLFFDILGQLPVAQNLLICGKETSIEEIQSFFYRAILCNNNTLFIVEINESFTDFQYSKILSYIDKLLTIQLKKSKIENKNIDRLKTNKYLNSCIIFIYDNNLKISLEALRKYSNHCNEKNDFEGEKDINNINKDNKNKPINNNNNNITNKNLLDLNGISKISINDSQFENIKVISSDFCGLGKSYKIRKYIEQANKKYYHFPLGGELTKKIIYKKLMELLEKIEKDMKKEKETEEKKTKKNKNNKKRFIIDYNKIALHIDLAESKEIPLINEFLLSFLITKFYINNEDIIYIPSNLNIYIEIPNCFDNYLNKIGILKIFQIENIVFGKVEENKELDIKNMKNIEMENFDIEPGIKKKLIKLIGEDKNGKIEQFIKDNIGIEIYSYHQIQIFVKLFINQYSKIEGKINFNDSGNSDIKNKCFEYFKKTTQLFTNIGFAQMLMSKNYEKKKDKFDLLYDAYNNGLENTKLKTPIIYVDPRTKEQKFLILGEENKEEKEREIEEYQKNKNNLKKCVDIVYLIDATGSMDKEINAANKKVKQIYDEISTEFKGQNLSFNFGAVFYRDKIDSPDDKNECFPLTNNMENLKKNIGKIEACGGGDTPEDWVEGYNLALSEEMKWRNGIKLIIHIADAGAHGKEFSKNDRRNYDKQGPLLHEKIKACVERNINIIGFKIEEEAKQSFDKIKEIYDEYKLSKDIKDNGQFIEIYDFNRKNALDDFYNLVKQAINEVLNPSYKYLKRLKQLLNLPNEVEDNEFNKTSNKELLSLATILKKDKDKENNYVITNDNYKKMVLLIYRIQANVPVIIMGETGCGKTALVKKLYQILNNGEDIGKIIKIHPGINDNEICDEMRKKNKEAKQKLKDNKEVWVFFDEINTCSSLSLLSEIFIDRTFKGEKLEENIRLIGACNPYRKKLMKIPKSGYSNGDKDNGDELLVYKVQELPYSLLFYVFSFGSISDKNERKYIESILKVENIFAKQEDEALDYTAEAISKCHIFLRSTFEDPSIVSLREITRFVKCVEFFQKYFKKKEYLQNNNPNDNKNKVNKIKSVICSIYLCYYIRLINVGQRSKFDSDLKQTLLKLVNVYSEKKIETNDKNGLFNSIMYKPFLEEYRGKQIEHFSQILELEEDFLLDQIELDKGIGKNKLLKENVFLLFLSVCTKIPLIIVGKPGTGKSLSSKLIINSMKREYSKENSLFKHYPKIIQTYFQGSKSNIPEDIEKLFRRTDNLYKKFKDKYPDKKEDDVPIYMILFDELGLAEKSPKNPLKVLHHRLEYDGKTEGVCFVGISNYSLDAAKVNRALYLSVPNLEDDINMLSNTAQSIVENISKELIGNKDNKLLFEIISRAYREYKNFLFYIKKIIILKQFFKQKKDEYKTIKSLEEIEKNDYYKELLKRENNIKTEFHGNRDFYNIIKSVAIYVSKLTNVSDEEKQIVPYIEHYIERNFGGIIYEIDIDFDFELEDKEKIEEIFRLKLGSKFKDAYKKKKGENKIKVSSVYIFKNIYNFICEDEKFKNVNYKIPKIEENYDLNKCINENIIDINSRYLLLEIEPNLSPLIVENIRVQNPEKIYNIKFMNGSPFKNDDNSEYKFQKLNEIQDIAAEPEKILILQNLDNIQPYLYDLYNMNYKIIDERKYVRICLENFSEQDTPVSETFRIIILVDKTFIDNIDMAFLNRLEKMQINFSDLLDNEQKTFMNNLFKKIKLEETVKRNQNNYDIDFKNLLINCHKADIEGLVYKTFIESKKDKKNINDIEDKIITKISNMLPQDIIAILDDEDIIKKDYYKNKKYYNFITYIKDIETKRINYKISIIYTFSDIAEIIYEYNNEMKFMISEIYSENQLKRTIDEMIKSEEDKNDKSKILIIQFQQSNSNKIQFISDYIINYCGKDGYKYIFLIHIKRRFRNVQSGKRESIYSIPNINNDINQIFIDNLNGPKITLENMSKKNIEEIMFELGSLIDEESEFKKTLLNFVFTGINSRYMAKINPEEYIEDLIKYVDNNNNKEFKQKIIKKAKELINEDINKRFDSGSLIDKILKGINKNSVDLISCIINYIKENIFNKNLEKIFEFLEQNNFLTSIIEIDKDINNKLDLDIIKILTDNILKEIKSNEENYEPQFRFGYKIPGFLHFYKNLSNLLNKTFTDKFLTNEKNLRKYFGKNPIIMKDEFHENEESILVDVLTEINIDKIKFEFYLDLIDKNKISQKLLLNDYIKFFLDKYIGEDNYFKSCRKIIKLLVKLRFSSEKNQIMKKNESEPINILLIKILWIESNVNYIKNILEVFDHAKNPQDYDGNIIYKMTKNLIKDKNICIKYIVNPTRNPEHTTEVNECFYILLAGLILSITSNEIKLTDSCDHIENFENNEIDITDYYNRLKKMNNILKKLNNELILFLNELYIIDEIFKIIGYQVLSIKCIEKIRNYLRESVLILHYDKKNNLVNNFINMYNELKNMKVDPKNKDKYYDMLKYIFMKEIRKLNDINYRTYILDIIINEKEVIKKSSDIFDILLKINFNKFKDTKNILLDGKSGPLGLLEKYLSDQQKDNYFTLSETLLYFYEKNSLIYLNDYLKESPKEKDKNKEKKLEKEPTDIFKDCYKYLNDDFEKKEKYRGKLIYITKIFCLAYIRAFCYIFVKMHDKPGFKPKNIIEVIDNHDYNILKMIKLYIYKIIYNQNNKQIDVFLKDDIKEKYKLSKYKDFKKFIKLKDDEDINVGIDNSDNESYQKIYDILLKYDNEEYKNKMKEKDINDINNIEDKLKFDNFYLAAYNLILSKLNKEGFDKKFCDNFYSNICEPLLKNSGEEENNKLLKLIKFIFNSDEFFKIISEYGIELKNIDIILYGYRYCLNEIANQYYTGDYIFSSLYNDKIDYLKKKLYPGSDTSEEPLYELYYKIENHFKFKQDEGCYVCLCEKGYYHSIPLGFPGESEKGLKCPYCGEDIGSKEINDNNKENQVMLVYEPIKRANYFRIFNDDDEISKLRKNKKNKLNKINYTTREIFKSEKIIPLYNKEQGLNKIDENKFKDDKKIIRNLSHVSYRLLNYILYSHLFFARLCTNSDNFDYYLPKGMTWYTTLKECFILFRNELEKKGIKRIELFMNLVFKELFTLLHDKECIENYKDLIDFEDDLEKIIQQKIEKAKELIDKFSQIEKDNCKDKTSAMALLNERFLKEEYDKEKYPYYEYFYYSDYPDENYIEDILEHKNKNDYPLLIKYLESKKTRSKKNNELYSINDLIIFNKVLNLFNEQYSQKISREKAESQKIIDIDLYQQNSDLINKFIEIFNKYEFKIKDKRLELNVNNNCLCDFILDENNKYGKYYKRFYEEFVKKRNKKLLEFLDIKSREGKCNNNCFMKKDIQQINGEEIFTDDAFKKLNFIEVMFNSSYRKFIDTQNYENYNDFIIFLDVLEEEITDLLLSNKRLLNCDLIGFKYKNEEFSYQINDLITNFERVYNTKNLDENDQIIIYDFIINNKNEDLYKKIINNFFILLEYLYKTKKGENEDVKIDENTKIYEIFDKLKGIAEEFKDIFKGKNDLTVIKISKIYDYYLKLIFKYAKKDLEKYQEKKVKTIKEGNKNPTKNKYDLDDKIIKKLDDLFSKKDLTITKDALKEAIRLFITIVLYREKDKEIKIKQNRNNIAGYLKEQDLWNYSNIEINDKNFNNELSKIKGLGVKVKEILWIYNYLIDNKEEDFEKDIEEKYKKYLKNLSNNAKKNKDKNEKEELSKDEPENSEESEEESDNESIKSKSSSSSNKGSRKSSISNEDEKDVSDRD